MIDARKHTLDSVKKLTDYSDFNLYKMDICYDYSIDKIIDRGIFDDESALGAIVQEVLPDYPVNLKNAEFRVQCLYNEKSRQRNDGAKL